MNLVIAPSGGQNLIIKPMALLADLPDAAADPATVVVYMKRISAPIASASIVATHPPGVEFDIEYSPVVDEYVHLFTRTFSVTGDVDYPTLEDAFYANAVTVLFRRETEAPVIGIVADATTDSVTVGVSPAPFARKRRVKRATALSGGQLDNPTTEIFDSTPVAPPLWIDIARGSGPQTIYIAVSHSSGDGTFWTPDSNILTVTFASSEGTGGGGGAGSGEPTGGSTGSYNPEPRNNMEL